MDFTNNVNQSSYINGTYGKIEIIPMESGGVNLIQNGSFIRLSLEDMSKLGKALLGKKKKLEDSKADLNALLMKALENIGSSKS